MFYQYCEIADDKPTVIFLNGLSQSTLSWMAIAPVVARSFNTLVLDLVFQGKSSDEGDFRTYDQHSEDVTLLVQFLKIQKPVLCGLSYGSAVAQHALVRYPSYYHGGILMSTFAHNSAIFTATGESWKTALNIGGYPLLLDIMLPTVLGATYFEQPLIPIATMKEQRVTANPLPINLLKLMQATEVRGDFRPHLGKVQVPTLVVHGNEDLLIPVAVAEQVASNISNSEFVVLDKVGHTLNLEAIPQVNKLIHEFAGKLR